MTRFTLLVVASLASSVSGARLNHKMLAEMAQQDASPDSPEKTQEMLQRLMNPQQHGPPPMPTKAMVAALLQQQGASPPLAFVQLEQQQDLQPPPTFVQLEQQDLQPSPAFVHDLQLQQQQQQVKRLQVLQGIPGDLQVAQQLPPPPPPAVESYDENWSAADELKTQTMLTQLMNPEHGPPPKPTKAMVQALLQQQGKKQLQQERQHYLDEGMRAGRAAGSLDGPFPHTFVQLSQEQAGPPPQTQDGDGLEHPSHVHEHVVMNMQTQQLGEFDIVQGTAAQEVLEQLMHPQDGSTPAAFVQLAKQQNQDGSSAIQEMSAQEQDGSSAIRDMLAKLGHPQDGPPPPPSQDMVNQLIQAQDAQHQRAVAELLQQGASTPAPLVQPGGNEALEMRWDEGSSEGVP